MPRLMRFIELESVRKDICTMVAWILSFANTEHIRSYKNLQHYMISFERHEIASLLLAIAAKLRIIRDTRKIKTEVLNKFCGLQWINGLKDIEDVDDAQDISCRVILDKILHATIDFQPGVCGISSVVTGDKDEHEFLIFFCGDGKIDRSTKRKSPDWEISLNLLKFCEITLEFIEQLSVSP